MKTKFIDKLYSLSKDIDIILFFDRIKDVFGDWIDEYLYGIEYQLELFESTDQYNIHNISIKMGYNMQTDIFEKNKQFNDINKWEEFAENFENKFNNIANNKRLIINIDGDIDIFSHL